MLFLSKTVIKNCLFLLKYHIFVLMTLGEIQNFQISPPPKKSFITSTTGTGRIFWVQHKARERPASTWNVMWRKKYFFNCVRGIAWFTLVAGCNTIEKISVFTPMDCESHWSQQIPSQSGQALMVFHQWLSRGCMPGQSTQKVLLQYDSS